MKTNSLRILFIFICVNLLYGNENHTSLRLSFNVAQSFIDENTVYFESILKNGLAIGAGVGLLHYNKTFDPLPFSPSQNKWPGTIYNGLSFRLTFSKYLIRNDHFAFFWGGQLLYKNIYYKGISFYDGGDSHVSYTRDEKSFILGCDIKSGMDFKIPIIKNKFSLFAQPNAGIGIRARHRNMFTYNIENIEYDGTPPKDGTEIITQYYLLPVIGLNIGIALW